MKLFERPNHEGWTIDDGHDRITIRRAEPSALCTDYCGANGERRAARYMIAEELRRELSSHRPRPFDRQGQVTLPVGLMMELGLGDEQPWVYFARALRPRGVRIIPQPIALRGWGQVSA